MNYNDAQIVLTPNAFKAGKLYAIKGPDATCVRATTANRINSTGATQTMGINVPLIDYSVAGCPVIDVRSADTITEVIPTGVTRVVLNKEDGTTTYVGVTAGSTYTIPVGRYDSILFDNGLVPLTYNFDITANWTTGDISYPVTDQASFEAFLANRSNNDTNNLTNIVITDFSLVGNKIQCNLIADGTVLDISDMSVTNLKEIGTINGLINLWVSNCINLIIDSNITLPNGIEYIDLSNCGWVFIPYFNVPSSVNYISFVSNILTTVGYANSEAWANGMHNAPSGGSIDFQFNTDSASGTNLETILTNKGWTVIV